MKDDGQKKLTPQAVALRIALGGCRLSPRQLADLEVGAVLELEPAADALADLYAGSDLAARGRAVHLDGKLGIRIQHRAPGGTYAAG